MESQSFAAPRLSALKFVRAAIGKFSGFSRGKVWRRRTRGLRVCETLSLGNRGYLAVVSYRRQEFLVGGTTNSIALLAQLAAPKPGDPEYPQDENAGR